MTKLAAIVLTVFALVGLSVPRASAQSGAKALFYGSSGAQLQTNAPAPGPMMSRPDVPGSNMATGFPSTPPMPGMPAPAPTMPAMTPPPAPPAMPPMPGGTPSPSTATGLPAMTPPPMPGGTPPPSPASAAEDLNKIVDQLKAAADTLPAAPPTAMADSGTKDVSVVSDAPLMGVKYWVELVDGKGARRQVTTEHVFRAGDRIKLHMTSNRDGYLTLVNLGSTGRTTVLFPSSGANNFVKAGSDYAVPPGGFLRFDENKGQETLILTFSPQAGTPTAAAALTMARGAKDLLTEVDTSSPQPATYAVAPPRPGNEPGTVAIQIKLNHQ